MFIGQNERMQNRDWQTDMNRKLTKNSLKLTDNLSKWAHFVKLQYSFKKIINNFRKN